MEASGLRDELNCSICLNTYRDPVMLRCGHSFCRGCIDLVLDTQEGCGAYTCPDCREESPERPALLRNIALCNIAEQFLPKLEDAGVLCTYCIHSPVSAVRSCLLCEASLCENHLQVHNKAEEHVLTEPSHSLRSRKCPIHMKVLEYFCSEDASCICVICCLAGEHRGHKVELLNEASQKKKDGAANIFEKLLSTKMETEKRIQSLGERERDAQEKAAAERERTTTLLTDVRRQLDDLETRVLGEISRQEEKLSLSISDLTQQLGGKKDEVVRKMRHIEELLNMPDPATVLQERETERGDFCHTVEGEQRDRQTYDGKVQGIGDLVKELVSVTLHAGLAGIVSSVKVNVDVQDDPGTIFDPNTAGGNVTVSDNLKAIKWTQKRHWGPETLQTFQMFPQVISTGRVSSGRYFLEWKMDCVDYGSFSVGMCYSSIERKGDPSCLGFNQKSWCLRRYMRQYSVIHNSDIVYVPHKPACDALRMYLHYEAGTLSFYELCEPMRHLYTFTAAFHEPLHAASYICGDYIKLTITSSAPNA